MDTIRYQSEKTEHIRRHGIIVKEGRKWMSIILIDYPIKIKRIHIDEKRNMVINPDGVKLSATKKALRSMVKRHLGSMRYAPKSVRLALK